MRLVGADAIEHPAALLGRGGVLDEAEVVLERRQAELAQPAGEPADEQRLLPVGQRDAGLAMDEIAILVEQRVVELPLQRQRR